MIQSKYKISIIATCLNEVENINDFYNRIVNVLKKFSNKYDYEIIVVDNKSSDGTIKILKDLAVKDKKFKVILNTKNFGPDRSSFHALKQSNGDLVINIHTDLEEPVDLIDKFISSWENGNKVAFGQKIESNEFFITKIFKNLYYKFFNLISKTKIIQNSAGFMLDKKISNIIKKINDPSPFLRGLIMELYDRPELIPFRKEMRKKGISKNNFFSLYDLGITGLVKLSVLPLRVIVFVGFVLSLIFFILGLFYLLYKIFYWDSFDAGIAPLTVGLFFISSFIIFILGIIGEYLIVLINYSKNIPNVVEDEKINFD